VTFLAKHKQLVRKRVISVYNEESPNTEVCFYQTFLTPLLIRGKVLAFNVWSIKCRAHQTERRVGFNFRPKVVKNNLCP
jgi:hypothetical protein